MKTTAKKTRADRTAELTAVLEQGVKDVFTSDRYKEFLACMAKFTRYSIGNSILIYMQRPDASHVAGFKAWQTKFNRRVKKGEKGIQILAPMIVNLKDDDEDKDEDKPDTVCTPVYFKHVYVFDISQTEGQPLPTLVDNLTGDVGGFDKIRRKLENAAPVPVEYDKMKDSAANGYYTKEEKKIVVRAGMSQAQTIKTLIHEIAHSVLHEETDKDRLQAEVEAESVAFVVCNALGVDSSSYSFAYVASWSSDKNIPELKKSLQTIQQTANSIIEKVV